SKIQNGSIENRHIQPRTIAPLKFEDGHNIGDLHRWNGFEWVLANEADILITEKDSIIGNEVTDATLNGSLERFGLGTDADPFTLDVRDLGIGNNELGPDAVTTDKILDGTILEEDIAENAVTSIKIQDGTIITDDIANDAITTIKIEDQNITEDKIADDAVTTSKIVDGNITLDKLADGTTHNNIIRWNNSASQWEETNISTGLGENVVSTDGSISRVQDLAALVAMDLEVNVDGTTLEEAPTNCIRSV